MLFVITCYLCQLCLSILLFQTAHDTCLQICSSKTCLCLVFENWNIAIWNRILSLTLASSVDGSDQQKLEMKFSATKSSFLFWVILLANKQWDLTSPFININSSQLALLMPAFCFVDVYLHVRVHRALGRTSSQPQRQSAVSFCFHSTQYCSLLCIYHLVPSSSKVIRNALVTSYFKGSCQIPNKLQM